MDNAFQELLGDFLHESRERLDQVEELLLGLAERTPAAREESLQKARRDLHTLKGNSGMMGLKDLQALAHEIEDGVDALDPQAPAIEELLAGLDRFRSQLRRQIGGGEERVDEDLGLEEVSQDLALGSLRVPFTALDELVEQLAEVLLYRNRFAVALDELRQGGEEALLNRDSVSWNEVLETHQTLNKTLDFLQERIIQLRMVPLQTLFRHLGRIVHDESVKEGKEVRFETEGGSTPLDKALLELAGEVLGHLVRNAVNHGIEDPGERRKAGKSDAGTVYLKAAVQGQEVRIEVADDGAGIDLGRLRREAAERGKEVETDQQLYDLLFQAGFTTREGKDISAGRGIGLSAVAEAVRRYGGRIEVKSRMGEGSDFLLRLPLSVSITRALLVRLGQESYALPLGSVLESLPFHREKAEVFGGRRVLRWRGEVVPVLDLKAWSTDGGSNGAAAEGAENGSGFAVVVEALGELKALEVDQLLGIQDIVVKGLDDLLGYPEGLSGSTILADGRVIMILDPGTLEEGSRTEGTQADPANGEAPS